MFKLNLKKINITAIILFSFFTVESFFAKAVDFSDTINFQVQFEKNLEELSNLFCFSDSAFYPGRFHFQQVNFETAPLKPVLLPFPEFKNEVENDLYFLSHLPVRERQNLVRYFSFFEKPISTILNNAQLPESLKYLPPAISALNPNADNRAGRLGIWQLTHFQTVLNGAKINRFVDERLNVLVATQVAARVLKKYFDEFKDPGLAVAALLAGPAVVKNAISSAGDDARHGKVLEKLPDRITDYFAMFNAMAVFLSENQFEPTAPTISADTVWVNKALHFQQVANLLGISIGKLRYLNPEYKYSILPEEPAPNRLVLPMGERDDFLVLQDSIYSSSDSSLFRVVTPKIEYPPIPNRHYLGEPVKDLVIAGKTKLHYRIKTGDVLGGIAEKYNVRVADLKYWNNIFNERRIQAGRKIDIFIPDSEVEYYKKIEQNTKERKEKKTDDFVEKIQNNSAFKFLEPDKNVTKIEHVVKSGESPYTIAKTFDGVTPELILEWNSIDDPRKIQIGQKLILYLKK